MLNKLYIQKRNYVDINTVYGSAAKFPEQMEFSIPGGINSSEIYGAYKIVSGKVVGNLILNQFFGG